jgi:hypothetical protein
MKEQGVDYLVEYDEARGGERNPFHGQVIQRLMLFGVGRKRGGRGGRGGRGRSSYAIQFPCDRELDMFP